MALMFGSRGATVVSRIKNFAASTFGSGEEDVLTEVPYQVEQAFIAIANGGMFGVGPGDSVQRYFLPDGIFRLYLCDH